MSDRVKKRAERATQAAMEKVLALQGALFELSPKQRDQCLSSVERAVDVVRTRLATGDPAPFELSDG